MSQMPNRISTRINGLLWIVQALLAILFLFAGGMKFIMPVDAMQGPVALPGLFLRFIGAVEILGAIGLVLPWLLHIRPELTPLAASGLVGVMAGATALTTTTMGPLPAVFPFVVGLLAASVALGRHAALRVRQS
jgi:hypothetical protein